jgi:hypothetical protein
MIDFIDIDLQAKQFCNTYLREQIYYAYYQYSDGKAEQHTDPFDVPLFHIPPSAVQSAVPEHGYTSCSYAVPGSKGIPTGLVSFPNWKHHRLVIVCRRCFFGYTY